MAKPKARAKPDWELIENEYRIGQLTVRQMADKHGVAPSSITRRAKAKGWQRDLGDQVRAATKAKLLQQNATERTQNAHTAIEVAATTNAQVVLSHREDIALLRSMIGAMVDKIKAMGIVGDEAEDVLTKLVLADELGGLQAAAIIKTIRSTCNTPAQVAALKALADALAKLVALEREAFSLDDKGGPAPRQIDLDKLPPVDRVIGYLNGDPQ